MKQTEQKIKHNKNRTKRTHNNTSRKITETSHNTIQITISQQLADLFTSPPENLLGESQPEQISME